MVKKDNKKIKINYKNLNIVKQWSFRPFRDDNEITKQSLSKSDRKLIESLRF